MIPLEWAEIFGFVRAFALTQVVEAPIYRRVLGVRWRDALVASTITHPVVWFGLPRLAALLDLDWPIAAAVAEAFAWSVEAFFFARVCGVPRGRAMLGSLIANGASVTVGLVLRQWGLV